MLLLLQAKPPLRCTGRLHAYVRCKHTQMHKKKSTKIVWCRAENEELCCRAHFSFATKTIQCSTRECMVFHLVVHVPTHRFDFFPYFFLFFERPAPPTPSIKKKTSPFKTLLTAWQIHGFRSAIFHFAIRVLCDTPRPRWSFQNAAQCMNDT